MTARSHIVRSLRRLGVALSSLFLFLLFASSLHAAETNSFTHKIQVSDPALIRQIENSGGRLIADYGSYRLYETAQAVTNSRAEMRDGYNVISLHAGALDTRTATVRALRKNVAAFTGKRLHLLQFAGPPQSAWHDELLATGVQIISYIPENTYLVYGDSTSLSNLQAIAATRPHIQWEGRYLDTYKIHPRAKTTDAQNRPRAIGTDIFEIEMVNDPAANTNTLQLLDHLKLSPLKRQSHILDYLDVVVQLDPQNLSLIAAQPDVVFILPFYPHHKLGERQDQIISGQLTGNVPTGPGYLAWLESVGFNATQFTNFCIDLTDSGIDNGTTAPGHFGLYVSGNVTNTSRVVYNRLEGYPNSGSTLQGCDGHGNLNAHILCGYDDFDGFPFADAAGFHYGLGVCPFASVGSSVIFDPYDYTYPDFAYLQADAYQNGARVSNNSWGTANSGGVYDGEAQAYDALVRDAQPAGSTYPTPGNQGMVIVFAAGNDGPNATTMDTPGSAKNVITVGATQNVQPFGSPDRAQFGDDQAGNANDILAESSRGPCSDGRIKPDLMAPGTHVSGGVFQATNDFLNFPDGIAGDCFTGADVAGGPGSAFWPDGQQFYTAADGTSHATPCVTGASALVLQYFLNQGNAFPSPAMTKAWLMNSARYLTGAYGGDNLPSGNQGMGELDLGMAFDGVPRFIRDQVAADLFTTSGQSRIFSGTIPSTNNPFRVTLAWTDAPGGLAGNAYDNNLDLVVTINGATYKGNIFNGAYSVTGGSADVKNNVESVFLPAGTSGNFTVTVTGTSINSVGVPNTGNHHEQDFALVAYNAVAISNTVSILAQPANQMAALGSNIIFQVTAASTLPLSYQWLFNGTNLPGATNSILTLDDLSTNDAGAYSVFITNSVSSVMSDAATLAIITPPILLGNAPVLTAVVGQDATLQVNAAGPLLNYQWSFNTTNLPNATASQLTLTNLQPSQAGNYVVTISNPAGAVVATPQLTILLPGATLAFTASTTATPGAPAITINSILGLNYSLQYSDSLSATNWITILPPVPGTGASITLSDPAPSATARYYRVTAN
jgi:hypothetical protein